jgi:hypothetical protein
MTATSQPSGIMPTPAPSISGTYKSAHKYKVTADVGTLVVDDTVGNITIYGRQKPGVEVSAYATYSSTPPEITRTVSGGTLTVADTCPAQTACEVTFVIGAPSGIVVRAASDTGSIWLKSLAGTVTAKADAGYIFGSGLTGQTAILTTDAGQINAVFTSPPTDVTANTMFGAINIQVPVNVTYHVITSAVGAQAMVSVPQDAAAARTITASTNLGGVNVTPSQL